MFDIPVTLGRAESGRGDTMRLTLHTDFSLRVLIQVGLNDGKLTRINDIAQSFPALIRKAGRPGGLSTLAALAIQDDRAS